MQRWRPHCRYNQRQRDIRSPSLQQQGLLSEQGRRYIRDSGGTCLRCTPPRTPSRPPHHPQGSTDLRWHNFRTHRWRTPPTSSPHRRTAHRCQSRYRYCTNSSDTPYIQPEYCNRLVWWRCQQDRGCTAMRFGPRTDHLGSRRGRACCFRGLQVQRTLK